MPKICLIGDVLVDVTLKSKANNIKLRMGGIIHAARCLWAMNIPYSVGYFAPAYLDIQIAKYLTSIGCDEIIKLGNVTGAPYVFLIEEVKEVGDQGYEFLLRDGIIIENDYSAWKELKDKRFDDFLLISGNYDLKELIKQLNGRIHLDVANNIKDIGHLELLTEKLQTVFISTSSDIFKNHYENDFSSFANLFENISIQLILKENRGGSRYLNLIDKDVIRIGSQTRPIVHSVGVGDAYNAVFVSKQYSMSPKLAMTLSSWIAAEYAVTTFIDDFKTAVIRVLNSNLNDLSEMAGVSLPWELRQRMKIYIAAPDFDYIDTKHIDLLSNSLTYHNFKPIRPIQVNGQMEKDASKERRQELFNKDLAILDECNILIAVMLFNDPGTLIEIGYASAKGIFTIVYDPYHQATNCMLTEMPNLISNDLDEIISEVFIHSSKLKLDE